MSQSSFDPPCWSDCTLPNDKDKEDFKNALYHDDVDVVKDFCQHFGKKTLNELTFRDDITPLMYSAAKSAVHCLRYLIQQGADVHAIDLYGRNACFHAAMENKPASIFALTIGGANINEFSAIGYNPILVAAHNSSAEVFKALLECGADTTVCSNPAGITLDDLVRATTDDRVPTIFAAYKEQQELLAIALQGDKGTNRKIFVRKMKPRFGA